MRWVRFSVGAALELLSLGIGLAGLVTLLALLTPR